MATFNELAKQYAEQIRDASRQDSISKSYGMLKEARDYQQSKVFNQIKRIVADVESRTYTSTGAKLSDDDKRTIYEKTAGQIGVRFPVFLDVVLKASVDHAVDVVDQIDNIINSAKPTDKN